MRVTLQMIDPELRLVDLVARILFRPSEGVFRLARRLDRRMHGSDVPGLECGQRWVDSLDEGVRVRVRTYRPPDRSGSAGLPGVLFLPGGGYAMGSPEQFASAYRRLMRTRACVGELDPFLDETVAYVEGLRAAGIPVEFRRYPGCYHGFDMARPGAKVSRKANAFLRDQFANACDRSFAKQP